MTITVRDLATATALSPEQVAVLIAKSQPGYVTGMPVTLLPPDHEVCAAIAGQIIDLVDGLLTRTRERRAAYDRERASGRRDAQLEADVTDWMGEEAGR